MIVGGKVQDYHLISEICYQGKSFPEGNIGRYLLRYDYVIQRSFDQQQYPYDRYSRMPEEC